MRFLCRVSKLLREINNIAHVRFAFPPGLHYTVDNGRMSGEVRIMKEINSSYIDSTLRTRKADAHKGDFGKILLFAGSPGMAGAAVLC